MGNFHTIHGSQDATVEAHLSWGKTSSKVFLYWIKIKKGFPDWKVCIFERLHPRPWAVLRKLLNLIYIWFFFLHFGRPPLWKRVRRTSCRGAYFLPSNNQVCKKKSPNKEFNSNIWFSTCSFSSEKQLLRDSLCDSNF